MNIKIKTVSIYVTYERNNIKLFNIMKGQQTTTIDKFYIHQYTSLGIKHALHTFLKAITRYQYNFL